ncbi:MAG TPA: hypothetical protein PK095_15980 [Myxococcota bacterium]|nr:hypothetical protein [Myxococcota bacterium]
MRPTLFLILSVLALAAAIYFFYRTGDLLAQKDYVGGLLYIVSGVALTRATIELGRLSVLSRPTPRPGDP